MCVCVRREGGGGGGCIVAPSYAQGLFSVCDSGAELTLASFSIFRSTANPRESEREIHCCVHTPLDGVMA